MKNRFLCKALAALLALTLQACADDSGTETPDDPKTPSTPTDPTPTDPTPTNPTPTNPTPTDPTPTNPTPTNPTPTDPTPTNPTPTNPTPTDPTPTDPTPTDPTPTDPTPTDPPQQEEIKAEADILDVVFNPDGSAKNIAKTPLTIERIGGKAVTTYKYMVDDIRYAAHFNNPIGGFASGYYRVNYGSNYDAVKALADGHTIEAVFRLDDEVGYEDEAKFFASHEKGGTGFLITKGEMGSEIAFLPHVDGDYIWCKSGIKAEVGRYYHVMGVWDKEAGVAKVYVDGALKRTIPAKGEFDASDEKWFGIGCDAGPTADKAWNGEVSVARIYDKVMTDEEVAEQYAKIKMPQRKGLAISNVDAPGDCDVKSSYKYHVYGKGFMNGDVLRFESATSDTVFEAPLELGNNEAVASIPKNFKTDDYRVILARDTNLYPITSGRIAVRQKKPPIQYNVRTIANRGYHPDADHPENSIAALKLAQEIGVYGSEFDVWMTADAGLVVYHDANYQNVDIARSTEQEVRALKLENGEQIPTLREYLEQGKEVPNVKMILELNTMPEITGHSAEENNNRLVDACVALVKELKMEDQVEWTSSRYDNLVRVKSLLPNAVVQYLGADKNIPDLANNKIDAISYPYQLFLKEDWLHDAHANGMFVNIWTLDNVNDMKEWISKGIDAITTNSPKDLIEISRIYVEPK